MEPNEDLDDEFKPTKIKIPKVKPGVYTLWINKTDIQENKKYASVTLKKQEFAGLIIPHGTQLIVDYYNERSSGTVTVTDEKLNKLLRTIFFDSLRTKKK